MLLKRSKHFPSSLKLDHKENTKECTCVVCIPHKTLPKQHKDSSAHLEGFLTSSAAFARKSKPTKAKKRIDAPANVPFAPYGKKGLNLRASPEGNPTSKTNAMHARLQEHTAILNDADSRIPTARIIVSTIMSNTASGSH